MPIDSFLGQDIRALRSLRKMTIEALAARLARSVGWVSQVERGLSKPTMEDLHGIAQVLDAPISLFFGGADAPAAERGRVVRAGARRAIGKRDGRLVETLVSPDLTDDFEVIHSLFAPGAALERPVSRPTTEIAYLASGRLDLWIEDDAFTVDAGDSFRIRGEPYRWANPYDAPAIAIWAISPPVY